MTNPRLALHDVDRTAAALQVRQLRDQLGNLLSVGTGVQPQAVHAMRRGFLQLTDQAERLMEYLAEGDDWSLALQTPRYIALIGDQVADDHLYRTVESEQRRWLRLLEAALGALEEPTDAPTTATPTTSETPAGAEGTGGAPETDAPTAVRAPKAFISHASEDKERFVLGFAKGLIGNGIEAWVDRWELKAGDKLVDHIFQEGIGGADVFIVVLSKNSIEKKWVREELNAGLVRSIEEACGLIVVVLDEVTPPLALRSRVWVNVADTDNYSDRLDEIVRAIYGRNLRPGLGPAPAYVQPTARIPGVEAADSTMLGLAAEQAIGTGTRWLNLQDLKNACAGLGLGEQGFYESAHALIQSGFLDDLQDAHGVILRMKISWEGIAAYVDVARPSFVELRRLVVATLVNEPPPPPRTAKDMATAAGEPELLVELVFEELEALDLVVVGKYANGITSVLMNKPLLSRQLDR